MIEIPTPVFVSQWVVLLALLLLVIVLYRQLAYVLNLRSPGSVDRALAVGQSAPSFAYSLRNLTTGRYTPSRFAPGEHATLLVFADPYCEGCEKLLNVLRALPWDTLTGSVSPTVVTEASSQQLHGVPGFRDWPLDLATVDGSVPGKLYGVDFTPFVFAVDREGIVRARDTATTEEDIMRLLGSLEGAQSHPVLEESHSGNEALNISRHHATHRGSDHGKERV